MSDARPAQRVEMIPIDRISVVNPRARDKHAFKEIVHSIAEVGLKRPITVTRRIEADGPFYDLVCGQGRLEAFRDLGQPQVPALVVSADADDCFIASLVENCARRQPHVLDLLHDIGRLRRQGYSAREVAAKTGLSVDYVTGVSGLLEHGEHRLLAAVESGKLPITIAVKIARSDDLGVQAALQEAYDQGLLKGKRLVAAKRIAELRRRQGRAMYRDRSEPVTAQALLRTYEAEAGRKRELIKRANAARDRLLLIAEALRRLITDEAFATLLESEMLGSLPESLASRLQIAVPGST